MLLFVGPNLVYIHNRPEEIPLLVVTAVVCGVHRVRDPWPALALLIG